MRIAGESIGTRGLALLGVTAVVGLAVGVHGWSARHNGLPPSSLSGAQATTSASPAATSGPGQASPSAGPTAGPTAGPAASPAVSAGPKLSSQSYASYAFQVWPGTPSATAQAAETGLAISVQKQGTGISVAAGLTGQKLPAAKYYATGSKVWVIEASMGDDSGSSEYNLGDDGLVVTDTQGRILQ